MEIVEAGMPSRETAKKNNATSHRLDKGRNLKMGESELFGQIGDCRYKEF